MSLITRCPACATMFKVVPDQLRVSEGWVRCGQCSEVFDASLHLQDSGSAAVAPAAALPSHDFPVDELVSAPAVTQIDIQIPGEVPPPLPESVAMPEGTDESVPVEPESVLATQATAGEPFLAVNPHALYIDPLDAPDAALQAEPVLSDDPRLDSVPAPLIEPAQVGAQEDSEPDDGEVYQHAFLKPSGTPAKPRRRWVSVALVLICGFLGMAMLLQVAVRERDRIVAMAPGTREALEPLCSVVGCDLSPLRQIESVVIDSSSFTKLRGDVYRLAFTLKNTSHLPLATPALELALTDLQDQTVVRKVFLVPDFADQRAVLEPGAELPVNLPVALKLTSGSGEKIAGYRLVSFYP